MTKKTKAAPTCESLTSTGWVIVLRHSPRAAKLLKQMDAECMVQPYHFDTYTNINVSVVFPRTVSAQVAKSMMLMVMSEVTMVEGSENYAMGNCETQHWGKGKTLGSFKMEVGVAVADVFDVKSMMERIAILLSVA